MRQKKKDKPLTQGGLILSYAPKRTRSEIESGLKGRKKNPSDVFLGAYLSRGVNAKQLKNPKSTANVDSKGFLGGDASPASETEEVKKVKQRRNEAWPSSSHFRKRREIKGKKTEKKATSRKRVNSYKVEARRQGKPPKILNRVPTDLQL